MQTEKTKTNTALEREKELSSLAQDVVELMLSHRISYNEARIVLRSADWELRDIVLT